MYESKMTSKERITITLRRELLDELDRFATALGMSRSELIEFLLNESFRLGEEIQKTVNKITKLQKEAKGKLIKQKVSKETCVNVKG